MKPLARLAVTALLLAAAGPATTLATPALSGSTGLIRIPTAHTLQRGEFDFAGSYHLFRRNGAAQDIRFFDSRVIAGIFGAGEHGAELGLHRRDVEGAAGSGTGITAKYRFPGVLPLGAFAVGGRVNAGGQDQNTVYVVGSTNAASRFAVHYGAGVNFQDARGLFSLYGGKDNALDTDRFYAMFGAELDIGNFKLNADYNGDSVAYGLDYFPIDSVVASLFWIGKGDQERILGGQHSLGFTLAVQF